MPFRKLYTRVCEVTNVLYWCYLYIHAFDPFAKLGCFVLYISYLLLFVSLMKYISKLMKHSPEFQ